jgi:hypothetical protein
MSELRQRKGPSVNTADKVADNRSDEDSDNDATPRAAPPPATAPKADNGGWGVRTQWTIILLGTFAVLIYVGHPTLTVLVMVCQIYMYKEIVGIGYKWNKEKELPLFRTLNWYFYFCVTFVIYTKALGSMILETPGLARHLQYAVQYNTFIFYSFFCIGKRLN